MMSKGHFISGCLAGLLCAPLAVQLAPGGLESPARTLALSAVFSAGTGLGALWPDIDHRPAFISKLLGPITWVLCRVMMFVSRLVYESTRTEQDRPTGCHRTLTHTLPFVGLTWFGTAAIMLGTPAAPWAWFTGAALGLGTLVHIGGDALTLSGVPLLWPLLDHHGRRWSTRGVPRWMRFKAGGKRGALFSGEAIATLLFTAATIGIGALTVTAHGAPWWMPVVALLEGS